MTKKEYSQAVKICHTSKCFDCDVKRICNAIDKATGSGVGTLGNWRQLSDVHKALIIGMKEKQSEN